MRALIPVCLTLVVSGCGPGGSSSGGGAGGGAAPGGGIASGGGAAGGSGGGTATGGGTASTDAGMVDSCPTQGAGALVIDAGCFTFTPAQAGADSGGVNATQKHIAMFTQPEVWSDWRRTTFPTLTPNAGA